MAGGGVGDLFPGVVEDSIEQCGVLGGQLVGSFLGLAVRWEGSVLVQETADVGPAALDEVASEVFAPLYVIEVDGGEGRVEQAEQVPEAFILSGVRGGGDKNQVTAGVPSDVAKEVVALSARLCTPAGSIGDGTVSFVDDDPSLS